MMNGKKFLHKLLIFNLVTQVFAWRYKNKSMFFGITILGLGVLFLLRNLGIITEFSWSIIWPILLIAVGLSAMFKKRKIWE